MADRPYQMYRAEHTSGNSKWKGLVRTLLPSSTNPAQHHLQGRGPVRVVLGSRSHYAPLIMTIRIQ